MLEKNIKLLIIPILLSAALSLAACSAPSETAEGNTPPTIAGTEKSAEESEKSSESESTKNASEDKKETADSKETTTVQETENAEQEESTQPAETTNVFSETALEAVTEQTAEVNEIIPVSEPVTESTYDALSEPHSEQSLPPISTTAPAPITTTTTITVPSVSITENILPTETQPLPTEPPSTEPVSEPVPDFTPEPVAEPTAEAPSDPALTGGRYGQRYCTETERDFADRVFELTNAERAKEGLPAFEKMDILKTVALTRAWELTVEYRADHTRPDGTTCTGAFNENGIVYGGWGENIAAGQDSPESVVEAWMNSPSHRAAILNKDYTYMGVGYYYIKDDYQSYYHFWTQEFYHY